MKTTIKTLFATALTAVVLTSSAFATFAKENDKNLPALRAVSDLNMIKVTGNVKVYLSQGAKENIRVAGDESDAKVSLKRVGGKLEISSVGDNTAIVYLTVKNLVRINASDKAVVKSLGNLTLANLQIFSKDGSQVDLNVTAQDVYTEVEDASSLKLSGSTGRLTSVKDDASKLNTKNFQAAIRTASAAPVFAKVDLDAQFAQSLNLASL
ncbi:GIN domain-containing protein [Pedobacter cryoconitis]|uniref:Putative auto-transporter adhesin head GIN domain-containing protein n=1 Tax=Pedobacter cryoconitis TaxID=188932 RepID=A0A7X0MGZ7_9SPHI|nr:DUF2807 domain-containing protein [Pedobacter cryoconitis]MBB6498872.1 hypothetical protein [Pedobacter cryoconitis]